MRTRDDLTPFFRCWPKWALVLASVLSLPVFLVCGAVSGMVEHYEYWACEVREMHKLQEKGKQ